MPYPLSIIVPANDEASWIDRCLAALLAQDQTAPARVIVSANACRDDTVAIARTRADAFAERGWALDVIDDPMPGKLPALDRADAMIDGSGGPGAGGARAYLDADVICDAALIGQLRAALSTTSPRYATGTLAVAPGRTAVTRAYARIWQETPFVRGGVIGAGLFAVNGPGRARWGTFPDIIADDTYARLCFAAHERVEVPALYHWPMVEGLSNLVRVRRRQDQGVRQIADRWPEMIEREGKPAWDRRHLARTALRDPFGMATYLGVHVATRLRSSSNEWSRGR